MPQKKGLYVLTNLSAETKSTSKRSFSALMMRGLLLAAVIGSSGCASWESKETFEDRAHIPGVNETPNALHDVTDGWSATPALQRIANDLGGQGVSIRGPVSLPSHVANIPIALNLVGSITINELVEILAAKGITLVPVAEARVESVASAQSQSPGTAAAPVDPNAPDQALLQTLQANAQLLSGLSRRPPVEGLGSREFYLPSYQGTVGELLEIVSLLTDASFQSVGGLVMVKPGVEYHVDLPQDRELFQRVTNDLESLGARDITASLDSGSIVFSAGASKDSALRDYMGRLTENNAMIGLQVAIVTVSHNRERNTGLDWSALQGTLNGGVSGTGGSNGQSGWAATLGDSRLGLLYRGSDFELSGLLDFLSRYGSTQAQQNLVLRTLSANPVEIRSGQSTPYVSELTTSSTGDVVSGGATTELAETGLVLDIAPYFNARNELITMSVDLDLSTITAFLELSAGGQGTITQPDIQRQSFKNTARLRAGETVVLGGLTYDEVTDRYSTLSPLENLPVDGQRFQRQQNSLFVVLRPTVTLYD